MPWTKKTFATVEEFEAWTTSEGFGHQWLQVHAREGFAILCRPWRLA
jgi:hypothetical protein